MKDKHKAKSMASGAIKVLTFLTSVILIQELVLIPIRAISSKYWSQYDGRGLNEPWFISSTTAILLVVLGVCFTFIKFIDKKDWSYIRFQSDKKWQLFLMGFGASFLVVLSFIGVMILSNHIRIAVEPKSASSILFYMSFSIVATFIALLSEELISRGYILRTLEGHFNAILGITVSSIVFSLFHLSRPNASLLGLVNIFLVGCVLSLLCIHFKSLWFPIGFHFGWNFCLYLFNLPISGHKYPHPFLLTNYSKYTPLSGTAFGVEDSAMLTILLIAFIAFFLFKCSDEILHKKESI